MGCSEIGVRETQLQGELVAQQAYSSKFENRIKYFFGRLRQRLVFSVMAVPRSYCSILITLGVKRSCKHDFHHPQQFFHRPTASWFLLTIVLLSVHLGAEASTCDDRAGLSFELGLERTTPHSRRLLAVNLTQNVVEDGEALLRIKATILTDPFNVTYWWKRSGANKALSPCKMRNYTAQYWPGINCTGKRVTSINLSNMSLSGTLSPYLGAITFLKSVDLSNNLFTGPIPVDLTSATHLETLNLANNRLGGALPASLGNWTTLTSLNVANNRLVGAIPAAIGSLQRLETLNVTGNNLTGAIPQELNRCGSLYEVDLSRNALQGSVPFQNLTNLTVLHLQENQLEGDFVARLNTLFRLEDLDLSNNKLNGTIPATISTLPLRIQLSLGHNSLTGEISPALGALSLVQRIGLSSNKFTGAIPGEVGNCLSLLELDVSNNGLRGEIPTTLASLPSLVAFNASHNHIGGLLPVFGSLKSLRVFDAAVNMFRGPIPNDFVNFTALQFLNLSYNELRGEVPFFVEHDNVNRKSFMHNRLCGVTIGIKCDPPSDSHKSTIISIAVGSSVAFVVLFIMLYVCCSRHYEKERQHKKFASVSAEFELKLTPEQILRATQNFNERSKIGEGSMGTVYKGVLPGDTQVAVKRLAVRRGDLNESAEKVLGDGFETLSHVRHRSLVKVLGYCCSPDLTALVMDYMPNGTLGNLMYQQHGTELARDFDWNHRFNTAIGVAEGLKYLHHECPTPTVHGNLKPSNILFNHFMEARIADFGVAKLLADRGVVARPTLEAGYDNSYKAPESANLAGYTMKGDVYSFGIIVLEMISGRSPRLLESGVSMPQWIRNTLSDSKALQNILDPILMSELEENQQKMSMVLGVALLCTREHPQERPYITEVLKMLSHIKLRPQDESRGSNRYRSSLSTHQRNEEIRHEVPGIEITPSPPITPPSVTPIPLSPHMFPLQSQSHKPSIYGPPAKHSPPHLLPLQSLSHNPSLSAWTPTAEDR